MTAKDGQLNISWWTYSHFNCEHFVTLTSALPGITAVQPRITTSMDLDVIKSQNHYRKVEVNSLWLFSLKLEVVAAILRNRRIFNMLCNLSICYQYLPKCSFSSSTSSLSFSLSEPSMRHLTEIPECRCSHISFVWFIGCHHWASPSSSSWHTTLNMSQGDDMGERKWVKVKCEQTFEEE